MLASLSHETGWRLPLAPREKARPLTSQAMSAQLLCLNGKIIRRALERQDTAKIFLYITWLGESCCISNRSSLQVGRRG